MTAAARPVNKCPHCGAEPCLPLWRKLTLGPASKAHCRVCDCLVGVEALRASAAMLPVFLLIAAVATGLLQDVVGMLVLLVVTVGGMVALYVGWVPLMPEQISSPNTIEAGRARRRGR